MIVLHDRIEIRTTPEKLLDWFEHLDTNFVLWNSNHKKFLKITGGMEVGDVVRFEQCISGKWYRYNLKISRKEISPGGWVLEARTSIIARLTFTAEKTGDSCLFQHIERFGFVNSPMAGKVVSWLVLKLFNWWYRFDLVQRDIIEDDLNLKKLLEKEDH